MMETMTNCQIPSAGLVHFSKPKIQGLFEDFPGPYFEISRTLRESNERALRTKTSVFYAFCEHFEDVILCLPEHLFSLASIYFKTLTY